MPCALIKIKKTTELSIYSLSLYKLITFSYEYGCIKIKILGDTDRPIIKMLFSFVKTIKNIFKSQKNKINHFKC